MPRTPDPCVVVMATTPVCIQEVVSKVKTYNVPLAIRGGRHSYIGASTVSGGVVIDVSRFKEFKITPGPDYSKIEVGAGNNLGEIYSTLFKQGLLYPGGTCPGVGISGLTLGGGKGVLLRKYGLSSDQLIEAKLVGANSQVLTASTTSEPDLYWALRGGGNGNYGIAYQFTLKAYPIPPISKDIHFYFHDPSDWFTMISRWQECLQTPQFESHFGAWSRLTVTPNALIIVFRITGDVENTPPCIGDLQKVPDTTPAGYKEDDAPLTCTYTPENYTGSLAYWGGCTKENSCGSVEEFDKCITAPTDCGGQAFTMQSAYQDENYLSSDGIKSLISNMLKVNNNSVINCDKASVQLDSLRGELNAYAVNHTAFPHRTSAIAYQFLSYYDPPCNEEGMTEWFNDFMEEFTQFTSVGKYRNYANLDIPEHNTKYFLTNHERLKSVKTAYDKNNLFKYSQSITPLSEKVAMYALLGTALLVGAFGVYHFCCKKSETKVQKKD